MKFAFALTQFYPFFSIFFSFFIDFFIFNYHKLATIQRYHPKANYNIFLEPHPSSQTLFSNSPHASAPMAHSLLSIPGHFPRLRITQKSFPVQKTFSTTKLLTPIKTLKKLQKLLIFSHFYHKKSLFAKIIGTHPHLQTSQNKHIICRYKNPLNNFRKIFPKPLDISTFWVYNALKVRRCVERGPAAPSRKLVVQNKAVPFARVRAFFNIYLLHPPIIPTELCTSQSLTWLSKLALESSKQYSDTIVTLL